MSRIPRWRGYRRIVAIVTGWETGYRVVLNHRNATNSWQTRYNLETRFCSPSTPYGGPLDDHD